MKELGYAELISSGWFGLFAPAKTPLEVVQKNSELVRQILSDPTTQTKLAALDMDASWNSPQAFRTLVDTEGRKWAGVVKASGFKADQ
jgi:tripartite-type tricarboxylate transporter receptor subunit TctC